MADEAIITIRFTPEFKRNLRSLAKKYRRIRVDIQPIIEKSRPEISSVIRYRGPDTRYSKSEFGTVIPEKAKAAAIG